MKTEAAEQLFDPGEALHIYEQSYLECRLLRHSWSIVGYYDQGGYVNLRLACTRCPTIRTSRMERRTGARAHPKYDWPDDYKIGGKVEGTDIVLEVLDRVHVHDSENDLMQSMITSNRRKRA